MANQDFSKINAITILRNNGHRKETSLHDSLGGILTIGQFFAIMPVNGIKKEISRLKFSYLSFKMFYTTVVAISLGFYAGYTFIYTYNFGRNLFNVGLFARYLRGFLGLILFVDVAKKWPSLMQEWDKVELLMGKYGANSNLQVKFKIAGFSFVILGIVQYVMYIICGILNSSKGNGKSGLENYYTTIYKEFFFEFEYAHWKVVYIELLSIITRFLWQYTDFFIVILSMALSEKFQFINDTIHRCSRPNDKFWRQLQWEHNKLSLLCDKLNDTISNLVTLSYAGNLYFTSILLYENLESSDGTFQILYQYYSAIFSFFHIFAVTIYASNIYEESKTPVDYLLSVPTEKFSKEVERFLVQLENTPVAINGSNSFDVDRGVVLEIASAVVALLLILIQFDQSAAKE